MGLYLKCWSDDIYIDQLIHRFWKLNLQLIARYAHWIKSIHSTQISSSTAPSKDNLSLSEIASIIADTHALKEKVQALYKNTIEPLIVKKQFKDTSLFQNALDNQLNELTIHNNDLVDYIVTNLCNQSIVHLKQAQDVPRLFRHTNRPNPTDPSSYISSALSPCISFHQQQSFMDPELLSQWMTKCAALISDKYLLTVSDVLNSVRKMEESMMRLQKMRKSKDTQSTGSNGVLSDDDKIRLQLSIDVETFGNKMNACGVSVESIEQYQSLVRIVEEARKKKTEQSS